LKDENPQGTIKVMDIGELFNEGTAVVEAPEKETEQITQRRVVNE